MAEHAPDAVLTAAEIERFIARLLEAPVSERPTIGDTVSILRKALATVEAYRKVLAQFATMAYATEEDVPNEHARMELRRVGALAGALLGE